MTLDINDYCYLVSYDLNEDDEQNREQLIKDLDEMGFVSILDSVWVTRVGVQLNLAALANHLSWAFTDLDSKLFVCRISCENYYHIHIPGLAGSIPFNDGSEIPPEIFK